jgi:hypothetical protein
VIVMDVDTVNSTPKSGTITFTGVQGAFTGSGRPSSGSVTGTVS